ncbi:NEDD8 ultimate buster 1-like [Chenopodium quinoa]|uniref:NEDD8 ultimate buster 1 n=1 Tax=Chenopodium quinoa TaxID=63459 RepID=A0A803LX05_CHEQI|nr:NEDD8 ultimate buster 1-like [Chenopodium quinoa]
MAAKLKIAGTWSGILEVELENWTVPMLRQEVANRSNCTPSSINLIFGGRLLKDQTDDQNNLKLSDLGLKNNAKILVTRVNVDEGKSFQQELMAEEQRSSRLTRLKAAVAMLAKRHADGSLPIDDYNIELEDQRGQKVNMGSETDQRAIMMGLMLHTKGKQLMRTQQYKDALEVLEMGEEAFSLCDSKLIECIDNVPILQIDMVWCYFMLRDINLLALAGERLAKARVGIERSHGKNASRARELQSSRSPEIALYLRLELLEGVAAFHCGKLDKSREALTSAKARYSKLQVSDEALSLLMGMGYHEYEAKRALKMNEQDAESAINFLEEEKEKKAKKREDDIKRQQEIREQKKFGKTPLGKAVDLQMVQVLETIGFERELAAEVLRRHENDTQKALDDLTNPELNSKIQLDIECKKRKRQQKHVDSITDELVSMGFDRSQVIAVVNSHGTRTAALNELLAQGPMSSASVDGSIPNFDPATSSTAGERENLPSSSGEERESPSSSREGEERDLEMEDELVEELHRGDAFSDYDIDVTKEAEALNEYLALVDSAMVKSN